MATSNASSETEPRLKPEEYKAIIKKVFDNFDHEKTGTIEINVLEYAIRALDFKLEDEGVQKMIADAQQENSNTIDFVTFQHTLFEMISDRNLRIDANKAFPVLIDVGIGKITFNSLKRSCQELGAKMSDEELVEVMNTLDKDGDGYLTLEDYISILKYEY